MAHGTGCGGVSSAMAADCGGGTCSRLCFALRRHLGDVCISLFVFLPALLVGICSYSAVQRFRSVEP